MNTPTQIDPNLKQFATARQAEILDAIIQHGGITAAARGLGLNKKTVQEMVYRVKLEASRKGYSPEHRMTHPVPETHIAKRVSTLTDLRTGEATQQWVCADLDQQRAAEMREKAFEAMARELPPVKPVKAPRSTVADLANLVVFTDYHLGMLAWAKEGGADWNLKIAEKLLYDAFAYMIEAAPAASTCIVCLQGDFLHTDGYLPLTPAHKNVLDADSRYGKIVDSAITVIRRILTLALKRHKHVHLIIAEGNHDEVGSGVWLRKMFKAMYDREKRMTVDDSELPFYVYQHGEVMLAFHHGHKLKPEQLPQLFAAQYPKVWGNTVKRYAHCGHRHHSDEKEYSGMIVTQHQTLAARDAHAARGGWHADRAAQVITYHKQYGQRNRVIVCPEMFESA